MTEGIQSFSEYPTKHQGIALVAGAGPDVHRELSQAKDRLSVAPFVIALNSMGGRLACDAIVTCHPERFTPPLDDVRPTVHYYPSDQRLTPFIMRYFDYFWKGGRPVAAGSVALPAVIIAKAIGFSRIILCGVPLETTGYVDGYPGSHSSEFRVDAEPDNGICIQRREMWAECQGDGMLAGVNSMGGYTKALLGEPDFKEMI